MWSFHQFLADFQMQNHSGKNGPIDCQPGFSQSMPSTRCLLALVRGERNTWSPKKILSTPKALKINPQTARVVRHCRYIHFAHDFSSCAAKTLYKMMVSFIGGIWGRGSIHPKMVNPTQCSHVCYAKYRVVSRNIQHSLTSARSPV